MLYAGVSGWDYPRWKPAFYPPGLPERRYLEFYSSRLNAVEVNYTFCGRHVLRPAVAERWLAQTNENFLFAFRAPKPITHFYRYRLRNTEEHVRRFEEALLPFLSANRLGPVLFQLPFTFPVDVAVLDEFLRRRTRRLRAAFEFRHPSWFTDAVYEALGRHGVALCLAERDETATPEILTAGFTYLRLRKSAYSPEMLRNVAGRIEGYARRGDVFAFFGQSGDRGPRYARRLARILRSKAGSRV